MGRNVALRDPIALLVHFAVVCRSGVMTNTTSRPGRSFTSAARQAALEARAAKRAEPALFGIPQVFVVKAGDRAFTWELRRFGGLLLQRGAESFAAQATARADGEVALAVLCAAPDLLALKRQRRLSDQAD